MVLIQIACASWSGGSVYAKHHRARVAPLVGAAVQMLFAGVALALVGAGLGEWRVLHFSARSVAALVYLILFGSIVAYGSYTYAVQKLPLSIVSTYSYVNPVIAVLLGWAVLAEALGWRMITAMLIILGGVALVKSAAKRPIAETVPQAVSGEAASRAEALRPTQEACSMTTN